MRCETRRPRSSGRRMYPRRGNNNGDGAARCPPFIRGREIWGRRGRSGRGRTRRDRKITAHSTTEAPAGARRHRAARGHGRRLGPMPRDWLLSRGSCGEGAPCQFAKPEGPKSAVEILPRFSCHRAIQWAEGLGGRKMVPTAARHRLQACADRVALFGTTARLEPSGSAW
jgi:hypothetical protein